LIIVTGVFCTRSGDVARGRAGRCGRGQTAHPRAGRPARCRAGCRACEDPADPPGSEL